MREAVRVTQVNEEGDLIEGKLDKYQIQNMSLSDYYQASKTFTNVHNYVAYDTAIYDAADITPAHEKSLFRRGKGSEDSVVNANTEINRKTAFHTNMNTDGEFEGGTTFILEMISVQLFLSADASEIVSKGEIEDPTVAAVAGYSAVNHYNAIANQFGLEFHISDTKVLDGLLYEFPSPFVASGMGGASVGGFVQNGFSVLSWNKLHNPYVLQSEDNFAVILKPLAAKFTPQVPFNLRVNFIGKRIRQLPR